MCGNTLALPTVGSSLFSTLFFCCSEAGAFSLVSQPRWADNSFLPNTLSSSLDSVGDLVTSATLSKHTLACNVFYTQWLGFSSFHFRGWPFSALFLNSEEAYNNHLCTDKALFFYLTHYWVPTMYVLGAIVLKHILVNMCLIMYIQHMPFNICYSENQRIYLSVMLGVYISQDICLFKKSQLKLS